MEKRKTTSVVRNSILFMMTMGGAYTALALLDSSPSKPIIIPRFFTGHLQISHTYEDYSRQCLNAFNAYAGAYGRGKDEIPLNLFQQNKEQKLEAEKNKNRQFLLNNDLNGDERIDVDEMNQSSQNLTNAGRLLNKLAFENKDTNGDEHITLKEMNKNSEKIIALDANYALFSLDTDGDNRISRKEFTTQMLNYFTLVDSDNNKQLSEDEKKLLIGKQKPLGQRHSFYPTILVSALPHMRNNSILPSSAITHHTPKFILESDIEPESKNQDNADALHINADAELHVISVYKGYEGTHDHIIPPITKVSVDRPNTKIVLVLTSGSPTTWDITLEKNTSIQKIFVKYADKLYPVLVDGKEFKTVYQVPAFSYAIDETSNDFTLLKNTIQKIFFDKEITSIQAARGNSEKSFVIDEKTR